MIRARATRPLVAALVFACAPAGPEATDLPTPPTPFDSAPAQADGRLDLPDVWSPGGADADADGHLADRDCDDTDPAVHPGAVERCNGRDDDCDGHLDADDPDFVGARFTWWPDRDGDGFGDTAAAPLVTCRIPDGAWTLVGGDCDDEEDEVAPPRTELCNGRDDDCDGLVDFDDPDLEATSTTWWPDLDRDGWGDDRQPSVRACVRPTPQWSTRPGDCDDTRREAHPDAGESCNDLDDDCDGLVDLQDPDIRPTAERCNGLDDDCDGGADDLDPDGPPVNDRDIVEVYWDRDGDLSADSGPQLRCAPLPGQVRADAGVLLSYLDCDDQDSSRAPHHVDTVCDGHDAACRGPVERTVATQDDLAPALEALADGGTLCLGPGAFRGTLVADGSLGVVGAGSDATTWVARETTQRMIGATGRLSLVGLTLDGEGRPVEGGAEGLGGLHARDVVVTHLGCAAETCLGHGLLLGPSTSSPVGKAKAGKDLVLQDVRIEDVWSVHGASTVQGLGLWADAWSASLDGVEVRGIVAVSPPGGPAPVTWSAVALRVGAVQPSPVPSGQVTVEDVTVNAAPTVDLVSGAVELALPDPPPLRVRHVLLRTAGRAYAAPVTFRLPSQGAWSVTQVDLRDMRLEARTFSASGLYVLGNAGSVVSHAVVAGVDARAEQGVPGAVVQVDGAETHNLTIVGTHTETTVGAVQWAGFAGSRTIRSSAFVDVTWSTAQPITSPEPLAAGTIACHAYATSGTPSTAGTTPPRFVDWDPARPAVDWDLHLAPGSPLRDAGDIRFPDPDGSAPDIGAYSGDLEDW